MLAFMKQIIIIAVAIVALVGCLLLARWAQHQTEVPAPSTTAPATGAVPSGPAPTPGDIDNGLGWG